ncbi:MAG: hypothetical protein R3A44_23330 [Caldilineaceae bacterium]
MKYLKLVAAELVLGALVAMLSVLTAISGYQSAMADSEQTKYNVQGQQMLTDANAEYLSVNQMIGYDYTMYDGWYTADNDEIADYYESNFSEELQNAIAANPDDPFSDDYYAAMDVEPQTMFDEADGLFELAQQFNARGDALQLILLVSSLGLAFAAWAALLNEQSWVRLLFALFSIAILVYSVVLYLAVPTVVT